MGAVLVHIDIVGDRPHPASLAALAAGRAVASAWGATLYAAAIVHDPALRADPTTARRSKRRLDSLDPLQAALARGGADKVVIALTDAEVAPLWATVGGAWQGVLAQLLPRLVLFGADSPSAAELGPRTGARLGARLLTRARLTGARLTGARLTGARLTDGDALELRDRDGSCVRAEDGGAAVVLVGGQVPQVACEDGVDVLVLTLPGGADARVEIVSTGTVEVAHAPGVVIALADDLAAEAGVPEAAARLGALLGAPVIGSAAAARAGALTAGGVVHRVAALAPELAVVIGAPSIELAGATSVVHIGRAGVRGSAATLDGPAAEQLDALARALEGR